METLADVTDRLTAQGYTDQFRAEVNGLRALREDALYQPDDLIIDEIHRFEGQSDPAEAAIVFAIQCAESGVRGTFTATYGPNTPALEARMVRHLLQRGEDRHRNNIGEGDSE